MTTTLSKPKKAAKIRLRPSEQARLNRVREFLTRLKEKMQEIGGEFMYDREYPVIITANSIDPKNMLIKVSKNSSNCLAAGWGPYYDEEAEYFEEWFEDFQSDFFTVQTLKV